MNWKEINEKCPKAFLEWAKKELTLSGDATSAKFEYFVDINESVYWFRDDTGYCFIAETDEARILPFYFDQFGIFVNTRDDSESGLFRVSIRSNVRSVLTEHFPDRLSATIAGAEKAFEIREQQLN